MKRYTPHDALPLSGTSWALLTAAVARSYPTSVSKLSAAAGISRFAGARAVDALIELGLVVTDDDSVSFNDAHPLADLVCSLTWRFSGVERPTDERDPLFRYAPDNLDNVRTRTWYGTVIPPEMLQASKFLLSESAPDGPDLLTARDFVDWARGEMPHLRSFERDGQAVFGRWHNERLRDMVHQTLALGTPTAAARDLIRSSAGPAAQGASRPDEARVSTSAWVLATYLVSAEAADLVRLAEVLGVAVVEGGRVNDLRDQAIEDLRTSSRVEAPDRKAHYLQSAGFAAEEATRLWSSDEAGRYKRIGGMPIPRDVGTAGDQMYFVRLVAQAHVMSERARGMSEHPAFESWATAHPDVAARFPLMTDVPDHLAGVAPRPGR